MRFGIDFQEHQERREEDKSGGHSSKMDTSDDDGNNDSNSSSSSISSSLLSFNESDCGEPMDANYVSVWQDFVYWCEGVAMIPIGTVGLLGNVFAIIVLGSK